MNVLKKVVFTVLATGILNSNIAIAEEEASEVLLTAGELLANCEDWGFVREIEFANLHSLDMPSIASIYGGKVPVQMNDKGALVPDKSVYRIRFNVSAVENVKADQILRGVVHIQGDAESFLVRAYKLVASVFIRESGF